MRALYKDIHLPNETLQSDFNFTIDTYLQKRGIDYSSLTNNKKHLALTKMMLMCNTCDFRKIDTLTPTYIESPDLVFISRSSTSKGNPKAILEEGTPTYGVVSKICS